MPANLTPQYQKAEAAYRRTQSADERVTCLERMLQLIPRHKGTERLQADLKTRLKEARQEAHAEKSAPRSTRTYRIPRQGAGTVILIGAPNSGKSLLLQELTSARPEVAAYPFTTREPLPGMMQWDDVDVQLVDTPPVTAGHIEPYLTSFVRAADAVVLCVDGSNDDSPQEACDVISQLANRKTRLATATGFDEDDMTIVNVRSLVAVTRAGDPDAAVRLDMFRESSGSNLEALLVECDAPATLDPLREAIYRMLCVMRLYTKRPGTPPEMDHPFTLPPGSTVEDLAERVHHDLAARLTHARVWGAAGEGIVVGRGHVLHEGDLVELHG
ncbi:GTPase Obg [Caulifigura coniformis]|uniref:GTPase Obg n=1 Tax=Caulifigura coniformis TaxID=2527983 RepID=A0A517SAP9_9PLAN|nr:GTPase [Caulifigura coniformis]QDT53193.1 GTPase Obg [Caulifigura coniformis]